MGDFGGLTTRLKSTGQHQTYRHHVGEGLAAHTKSVLGELHHE
jgi:hypothetical protein